MMGQTKTSRIWNLNGLEDPRVDGRDGMLEAYQKAIGGTQLAGPTYFYGILNKVRSQIFYQFDHPEIEQKVYHLVIFITDGNCHDMEATKKILV